MAHTSASQSYCGYTHVSHWMWEKHSSSLRELTKWASEKTHEFIHFYCAYIQEDISTNKQVDSTAASRKCIHVHSSNFFFFFSLSITISSVSLFTSLPSLDVFFFSFSFLFFGDFFSVRSLQSNKGIYFKQPTKITFFDTNYIISSWKRIFSLFCFCVCGGEPQ